jgi:hypothetical protein
MPYKPYTPTEVDRGFAYKYAWAGAAASVISLALYLFGIDGVVKGWTLGAAVGGLLASKFNRRIDDYYVSLCSTGERWLTVALAGYLLCGWFIWTTDMSVPAGLGFLAHEHASFPDRSPSLFFDGMLAAHVLVVIFYAGYTFHWAHDRFTEIDDEA